MKNQSIIKRMTSLLLAICMVLGLIIVPTDIAETSHVHAASSSAKEHDCSIANEGYTLDQATMSFFVANGINVGGHDFSTGPLIVSATEEIHWQGTLTVPDGMFIGICTGGFDYSMGTLEFEGRGGIYLLNCETTLTEHKSCQAFTDTYVAYLTQDIVTLYEDWATAYGINQPVLNQNITVALAEDITFRTNILAPAEGYARNICKNGYTLTFGEGVDFTAFGGEVNLLDCTNMPKIVHECTVAHENTAYLTQENVASYIAQLPYVTPGTVVLLHLAEDVVLDEDVTVPDGVLVGLCLNGSTISGLNVTNAGSGGFFTYDCEEHTCRIGGESMEAIFVLTQDVVNFLEEAYELGFDVLDRESHVALAEDVTLASDMWLVGRNNTLTICKNGYEITDNVGINYSTGTVLYVDCNTMLMKDLAHESMLLGSSYPMAQETLNNLTSTLDPYLYNNSFSLYQYNYWSFLDANGNISYISQIMPNEAIAPLSYTTSTSDAFCFVACSEYVSNNYTYAFSATARYNYSENSSWSYTAYIVPARAEDGSLYLAMVNCAYVTYDSELMQYFAKYNVEREVTTTLDDGTTVTETETVEVKTPIYFWNIDYSIENLTTTIDGVTYYLAADAENGCYLEKYESYDAERTLTYSNYEYRYGANDGVFVFHLSEDVSWEGTLSVPAGKVLIILTNGHTATGDYVHGQYGGVYVFNDDMHICPSAPETPITITSDFIDLLLLMEGDSVTKLPMRLYVALGEDITSLNPNFVLPSTTTLYICYNGYTISDDAVARLTANGGSVEFINCDDLSHDECGKLAGVNMQPVNRNLMVNFYQNSNGVFQLGAGTYYLYLTEDITLEKELKIPAGVELHICLNGYTIKSPKIITDSSYPADQLCNGAISIQPGGYLKVYDCSPSATGCITPDVEGMNGWGALVAYAVANEGVFILDSGSLFGMVALISSGEAVVNGGHVYGVLAAVAIGSEVTSDFVGGAVSASEPTFTANNVTITAVMIGVMGTDGEIILNDTNIKAGVIGLGSNFDSESTEPGADMVIDGGAITVGSINLNDFLDVIENAGVTLTEDLVNDIMGANEQLEDGEFVVENDELYGIITNASLTISKDVEITLHSKAVANAEKSAEIMLGDNASVAVTPGKDGSDDNNFSASGNISALPEGTAGDTFTPGKGEAFETDENGKTVVVDVTTTADVIGSTISTSGLIMVNLYTQLTESFVNNPNARLVATVKGTPTEFKVSDAKKSGDYYIFSIGVYAMYYLEDIYVSFTDGTTVWDKGSITINQYLENIINDTTGRYDAAKELAVHMQNYCMTAAAHFKPAQHTYNPGEEMQVWMAEFDLGTFSEYENYATGASDNVQIAGSTLLLEEGTTLRIYFALKTNVDVNDLVITVDGKAAKAQYSTLYRLYYVDVDNIAAHKLADFHEISIDGLVAHAAALTYCYTIYRTKGSQQQDLIDVCKALYGYYEAAYKYAHGIK